MRSPRFERIFAHASPALALLAPLGCGGGSVATCYDSAADASAAQSSCSGSPAPGDTGTWQTTVP